MGNSGQKEAAQKAFQWYLLGEYTKSKEIYDGILLEATKNGIKNAGLHHDYALLMSNGLKDYASASKHYLKSIEYCVNDDTKKANYCGNYAGLLHTLKQYNKSEEYFKRALNLNPNDIHHLSNYADLLRDMCKYKESKIKFNKVISIIESSEKNKKNNIKNIKNIKKRNSKSVYKRKSLLDNKGTSAALLQSNAFTKKNIGKTYSNYGLLLFSMKLYAESGKIYRKAIEIDQDNQIRHYNYARLLYDTQSWSQAINHLNISLDLSSNKHSTSNWLLGRILMEQNDFDKSQLLLKNAINLNRNNPLYRCDYILCLIESAQYEDAVNEMQNYKKLKLNYLYFDLIYTYFIAKVRRQKNEANKYFDILLSDKCPADHPTSINSQFIYYYYYAWFNQYILNDYDKANKYYNNIVTNLRPLHSLSLYHYSVSLITKWIYKKQQPQPQDNNDDDDNDVADLNDDNSNIDQDAEMIKDYRNAKKYITKAYELNNTIPIINDHYQQLLDKIKSVIGDQVDDINDNALNDPQQGFTIVISNDDDDDKKDNDNDNDMDDTPP